VQSDIQKLEDDKSQLQVPEFSFVVLFILFGLNFNVKYVDKPPSVNTTNTPQTHTYICVCPYIKDYICMVYTPQTVIPKFQGAPFEQ